MPVTYKGAIKKKTRRRRLLPKIFRQELEEHEMSVFECLSIDEIKKVRTVVTQKQALQKIKSENQNSEKETKKCRVKFQLRPDKFEKSPVFCPGSPNSTFDNLVKQTPLQPLKPVNCNTNSCVSNTSSSGNSLQLGSAHRYFTRRQALLGNLSSHSENSNSEWSVLYQSRMTASPDLIPSTPLTTFTKPKKKHQLSKAQNATSSIVISRNKELKQLPRVVSVPQAQVTSTPVENQVVETDLFSVSPLSSIMASEFVNSVMREYTLEKGSKGSSEEEKFSSVVEDILTSRQSTENMSGSKNINLLEVINDTSVEENLSTTEPNAKTLHRRKNRLNTVKNLGTVENVLIRDKNWNCVGVEKCSRKSQGSLPSGDVMNLLSNCSTHRISFEGTVQEHKQNVCEKSSINSCINKHFSSVSLKNLDETVNGDIIETEDLLIPILTNECCNSTQTSKFDGTVAEEGVCNSVSTGLSSDSPISCNIFKENAHEYIHTVCGHPSSSSISNVNEVEASITDTLVLTCSDVTAELSLLLEESLSLSQPKGKSNAPTTSESLSCLASSNTSCRSHTIGETSLPDGVQQGSGSLTCPSLPDSVQHLVMEGMSNILSDACVPSASSGLAGSCSMNSLMPAQDILGICSPVEDLQCRLSSGYRRMFPGLRKSDSRLSGQSTPKQRCYRQSYSVVVRDVEPSLSSHHSSGFRSLYSTCPSETAENYQRVASSELRVVSVSPAVSEHSHWNSQQVTARELVLQKCGQKAPIPFSKAFSRACLNNCKKIGEGVYGEVFLCENGYRGTKSVLKIIPIEGEQEVNCAAQKKFEEILSEIVIAMELSSLRNNVTNTTSAFSEVLRCLCVVGRYPRRLIELWNKFADEKTTENDSPEMFDRHQLFIILELCHAGTDLEAYVFLSAHQTLSVFQQVTCGLAVAEVELEFEHRDLHWGNVLVSQTFDQTVSFKINGSEIEVETKGVKATIIDFTLSRMTFEGCQIFNDLLLDPDLFVPLEQCSDYQFKIYTLMRIAVQDDWKRFEPKTNIHWLHYLVDKLIKMARYLQMRTKVHLEAKMKLQYLCDCCLLYSGATEFVDTCLQL